MQGASSGASFSLSSDYVNARSAFDSSMGIVVYVEGFEDVPFWKQFIKVKDIAVKVIPYGIRNKANGKGAITNAIRNEDIILGKSLLAAIDSDYDYLLDKNTDIFGRDTVFQTYAYSIENLRWNPRKLDMLCQLASNDATYLSDSKLELGVIAWSRSIFPLLLEYLRNGACSSDILSQIMGSLQSFENAAVYKGDLIESPTDESFIQLMASKGLTAESSYLFVRGHDYADCIGKICRNIKKWVFEKTKMEIEAANSPENAKQLLREFDNHQGHVEHIIKGFEIECDIVIPKIMSDVNYFISKYY